ncbi:hypothetical protein RISK_002973 [Rhodopirellula islandica]|uniref:Uncharacterized protein n=1 Tax=Rhodopirellula islandica TaxID=595434 RepID=A0A0J1BEM3_RHOIS|nr:hypothetical protein RISK_002973 [Rhodopirellula islandica]
MKLSDELVDDARTVVPFSQRSIAGQIEFWAGLGKSIEPLLRGDRSMLLQRSGSERSLSQAIADVDTAKGRKQVDAYLEKRPYPHYKPVHGNQELLRRVEADGTETIGRFVERQFVEVENEH